ncbi:MAG: MurR/RpiR family transcriptional regulator [Oscillospiraceae bacterium]
MPKTILSLIQSRMSTFSKGQKRIAEYILNHYDHAAYMTAAKLGAATDVSESTVVRFAFELGFGGYPELQEELMEMIKNKLTSVQRIELAKEQLAGPDVLSKVLNLDIEKIKETLEETSIEDFNGAVSALCKAKSIYIIGSGSASILARFMALYFNLMFQKVKLIYTPSASQMFEEILQIDKDDIMIGISFPRYSKKTVKALEYAKSRQAKVISITDSIISPIVKPCDFFLQARSDMASFVDSLVAPLSLINALIVAVGLEKQDEIRSTFERLETIWDEYEVYQKTEDI